MVQEINNLIAENYNVLPDQTVNRAQYEPAEPTPQPSVEPAPLPEEEASMESSMPTSVVDTYA